MSRPGFREWMAVGRVIARGQLLRTDLVRGDCVRFEEELAAFTGARHALAVSSGTAALICALQACGIGPGDEVLVPAYTWMATAAAVLQVGAVPVLVDVDDTLTMDPADLSARLTQRSRAVIPVHMINRPCDMDAILAIARNAGLRVIEDAAQAVGVRYRDRFCGTMGDMGVFSFNQHKNMTCGEGGAILTDDSDLYARAMNAHDMGLAWRPGQEVARPAVFVGGNFRISEIQGAILRVQLRRLPGRLARMRARIGVLADAAGAAGLPVARHADPGQALSLAVTFTTEEEAIAFARRRGVRRLFDNSKHLHTEWTAIRDRRMAHPAFDPWAWAGQPNTGGGGGARSIDILRRSCQINALDRYPMPVVRAVARRLAEPV